jgi:hypothetical protein
MVMVMGVADDVVGLDRAGGDDRGNRQPGDRLRRQRAHARRDKATGATDATDCSSARRRTRPAGARHVGSPGAGG